MMAKGNSVLRIWDKFPQSVVEWAFRNVKVDWDVEVKTSKVSLQEDGYHLLVNEEWFMGLSEDHRVSALTHSVAHIVRGDALVSSSLPGYDDRELQHLAQDALINENQSLHDYADNNEGLRVGNSEELIGVPLNPYSFSWMSTYNELKKASDDQQDGDGDGDGDGNGKLKGAIDESPSSEGDQDKLRKQHAKAAIDARGAMEGTELEGIVNGQFASNNLSSQSQAKVDLPPPLET